MPRIFIGDTNVKKIYIENTAVKKVYIENTLAWASVEDVEILISNQESAWGSNYFATRVAVWVKQKNYADNQMTIQVQVNIKSKGGTISSTASKTGTVTIDGQQRTFNFTAGLTNGQDKQIALYTDIVIPNASAKTIRISTSLPININLSGIGNVGVVNSNFDVALPTL